MLSTCTWVRAVSCSRLVTEARPIDSCNISGQALTLVQIHVSSNPVPFESWQNPAYNAELQNDPEMRSTLAAHDAIRPSGNAIADARAFEAFDTKGTFARNITDEYSALRHLVGMRQNYEQVLREGGLYPVPAIIIPKRIEVLDRLLDYYQVKSRRAPDFDEEWDQAHQAG